MDFLPNGFLVKRVFSQTEFCLNGLMVAQSKVESSYGRTNIQPNGLLNKRTFNLTYLKTTVSKSNGFIAEQIYSREDLQTNGFIVEQTYHSRTDLYTRTHLQSNGLIIPNSLIANGLIADRLKAKILNAERIYCRLNIQPIRLLAERTFSRIFINILLNKTRCAIYISG